MNLITAAPVVTAPTRPSRIATVIGRISLGVLAGTVLGAIARGWMRLVTEDPEFTWSGTIFIVAAFAITGAGHAIAWTARRRGRRAWRIRLARTVGGLLTLPLFVGAGAMMLPTVAGAAVARWRDDWPLVARVVPALVAVPVPIVIVVDVWQAGVTFGHLLGLALLAATYVLVVASLRAVVERTPPSHGPDDHRSTTITTTRRNHP